MSPPNEAMVAAVASALATARAADAERVVTVALAVLGEPLSVELIGRVRAMVVRGRDALGGAFLVPTARLSRVRRGAEARQREIAILRELRGAADPAERQRLVAALIQAGDWRAQVSALARRWRCDLVGHDEFVQAGLQGVLEAASRYDGRAAGWPTFATYWARYRVAELARANGPIVSETQWERRQAKRTGAPRRHPGWLPLGVGPGDEGDSSRSPASALYTIWRVDTAAMELQAAQEDHREDLARREALAAAVASLSGEERASIGDLLGERGARAAPGMRERTLSKLREMLT